PETIAMKATFPPSMRGSVKLLNVPSSVPGTGPKSIATQASSRKTPTRFRHEPVHVAVNATCPPASIAGTPNSASFAPGDGPNHVPAPGASSPLGQSFLVSGSARRAVTLKLADVVLFAASLAVNVTVVTPIGKVSPLALEAMN